MLKNEFDVRGTPTRFTELTPAARAIWAKSGDGKGHGLLAHMLDVAAVAETLLETEPPTTVRLGAEKLGLPLDTASRWIAALIGLHDFGKAIPGFQCKWPDGQSLDESAGLEFSRVATQVTDHACASGALLSDYLQKRGFTRDWVRSVLQAISAHHGYNFLTRELKQASPLDQERWKQVRAELFEAYWQTLSPEGVPAIEEVSLAGVQWLAGLTSVCDWIGSNPGWFPLQERDATLSGHYEQARVLAAAALRDISWNPYSPLMAYDGETAQLLARILQTDGEADPRPLQEVGDCLLRESRGQALLVVEAPMGEGKTELAFLAHLRLQRLNDHRGLYVALPTKATGNALFDRAVKFLKGFADEKGVDIQLVHGGAAWNEQLQQLKQVYGAEGDAVASSAWFSQRRRPLLSPYGVGTVDQALFATLNVKHHFVRLWGLSNRVIVLDEVHAYDWYTGGLIETLLRWLKPLGCSVVLMSATLPRERRQALLNAWDNAISLPQDTAYPRVLLADSNGVREESFESRPLPSILIESVDEDVETIASLAVTKVGAGGYGAVIVNTVDRAQQLYRLLLEELDEDVLLLLFHARFPADDREAMEGKVLHHFGSDNRDRKGRALLIATQVAEQSLDIDFDFLITDLAPVDLVLQRAGRLHRHDRGHRSEHREAVLTIAGLHRDQLPDLTATAWEFVYNKHILGRTWAFLSREHQLQMPWDIDRLVQIVYDRETPIPDNISVTLKNEIEQAEGDHLAEKLIGQSIAHNVAINPNKEPQDAYVDKCRGFEDGESGLGLRNETRLNSESVTVVPVHEVESGWALSPNGDAFLPDHPITDKLARKLYARQLSISRNAVVHHFQSMEAPESFSKHSLLRHLKPMPLREGSYESASISLALDKTLGLIYADSAKEKQ